MSAGAAQPTVQNEEENADDIPIEKTAKIFRTLSSLMITGSMTQQNYMVLQKMVLEGDPEKVQAAISTSKCLADDATGNVQMAARLSKIAEEKVASVGNEGTTDAYTSSSTSQTNRSGTSSWDGIGEPRKMATSTKFSKGIASRLSRFATTRSLIVKQAGKEGYAIFCAIGTIIGRYFGKPQKLEFQEKFCMLASKTSVLGAINTFNDDDIRNVVRPLWKLQGNVVDQIELSFCSNVKVLQDHVYVCLSAYENLLRSHVSPKTVHKIKEVQKMCSNLGFLKFLLKDPANEEEKRIIAKNVRTLMERAHPQRNSKAIIIAPGNSAGDGHEKGHAI